ncbi:MAG: hypothetical protein JXA21_14745 [Anaerolineae bacterium]|nr:hypothetical protein [Anaerolineae bacterium]
MFRKQSLCLLSMTTAIALALLLGVMAVCRADALTPPGSRVVTAPQSVQNAEMTVTAGLDTYAPFAMAYNSDLDEYLVVWRSWQPGEGYDVRAQRVSGAGVRVGEVLTVTAPVSTSVQPDPPAVTYNPDRDEFVIVWRSETASCLQGQRVSSDGVLGELPFTITTSLNSNPHSPSLVYAFADHVFLLVWRGCNVTARILGDVSPLGGGTPIGGGPCYFYTQILDGLGVAMGEEITATNSTYMQAVPASTYIPNLHEFWVVWTEQFSLKAQRVFTTGALAGEPFTITTQSDADILNPAISNIAVNGEFLAVWENHPISSYQSLRPMGGGYRDIYGQRVSSNTLSIGDRFRVSANDDVGLYPKVFFLSGQGRYVVSWMDIVVGGIRRDHCVRWISADGIPQGSPFLIGAMLNNQYLSALTGGDNTFFVAWKDERDNISIRGRILERAWWVYLPLVMRTN